MGEQEPIKKKKKKKTRRNPRGAGRNPVLNSDKIKLVEEAWELGATDEEACLNAGISRPTLVKYIKETEGAQERKELLKNQLILTARKTISTAVKSLPDHAWKYLEKKKKDEFGDDPGEGATLTIRTLEALFNRDIPMLKEQTLKIHSKRKITSRAAVDSTQEAQPSVTQTKQAEQAPNEFLGGDVEA